MLMHSIFFATAGVFAVAAIAETVRPKLGRILAVLRGDELAAARAADARAEGADPRMNAPRALSTLPEEERLRVYRGRHEAYRRQHLATFSQPRAGVLARMVDRDAR